MASCAADRGDDVGSQSPQGGPRAFFGGPRVDLFSSSKGQFININLQRAAKFIYFISMQRFQCSMD